jgi:hypothetical protein
LQPLKSVNTPLITSFTNDSCVAPRFIQTRFSGGGFTDSALYNATTGTFHYGNYLGAGVNRCINGNCALPGETSVVNEGCYATVSVFTVDYSAPLGKDQTDLRVAMEPLVAFQDPTSKMAVKARGILTSTCFLLHSLFLKTRRADIVTHTEKELEDSSPLRHE